MSLFSDMGHKELEELRAIRRLLEKDTQLLEELVCYIRPRLTSIAIQLSNMEDFIMGSTPTPNLPTTITLAIGQVTIASVVGFDQFGNPWTGPIPTPTWSIDQPSVVAIVPDTTVSADEDCTALTTGTANLTAGVALLGGGTLTATAQITVASSTTPVLTSIAIELSTPAASVAEAVAKKKATAKGTAGPKA
jgi:hypothetical protein